MASHKNTHAIVPPVDSNQVQHLLEQRHEIAEELHHSTSRQQAETALAAITNADEGIQMALLKALAKQHDTDAADVLLAINELTPNKTVRKESRRAVIQLAGAKVYPSWTPERETTPVAVEYSPRFWKGSVTQMREEGEIQLILCWEQGFEYSEARIMVFLLDFWQDGVRDFITEVGTKRRIDTRIKELNTFFASQSESELKQTDCTLAEGRRLLLEALSVNKWRGSTPHKDYRHHLPTVQQLVLNATNLDEDRGRTFINPDLAPDEIVANFAGGWSMGDYGLCYDLLASSSELLVGTNASYQRRLIAASAAPSGRTKGEGLSRVEWIDLRRKWADEAHPARLAPSFIREREHNQQSFWLPNSFLSSRSSSQREVEMGWSLELNDTPLSGTLPEMPMGTAVFKETGRHWFWTSYTLVQEEGEWRISRMTDEGAYAQGLPIAEIQQRLQEHEDRIHEITHEHSPTDPDAQQYYEEIIWSTVQALHYYDALLVKLSLDRTIYEDAYSRAMSIGSIERAIVYLENLLQHFPRAYDRGNILRRLVAAQVALADQFDNAGMVERSTHFFELAEANIRESLAVDNQPLGHILLAELLVSQEKYDEAEAELSEARSLTTNRDEEAQVEFDLATIAMQREQYDQALQHFERVAQINPNYEGIWFNIGRAYRLQKNFAEAEVYYKRAIEAEPHDVQSYSELGAIYMDAHRLSEAYETVEQGVRANPGSAHLRALLAAILLDKGERRRAQKVLEEAERINPDLELVQTVRRILDRK